MKVSAVKVCSREVLKTSVKFCVGSLIIYYVLQSRMVDFKVLGSILFNPKNLIITFSFLTFITICCSARWYILAKTQKLTLSFKNMAELTMIGNFFNTFMPGSVGGDLIKAWYVAGKEPTRKTKAVFTVLLDRVIGLAVIVFYAGITLLFYTSWLKGRPELQSIALFIWCFTGFSIAIGILFFSRSLWELTVSRNAISFLKKSKRITTLLSAIAPYRHHLPTMASALALSAISILSINLLYSIHGNTLGIDLDMAHYFFIVPIGVTVSAIPLLPGGIGVGQVAFYKIFEWTGVNSPEQGSTLCTVLQIYTILFNCSGALFYMKFKLRPQDGSATHMTLHQKGASPTL